MTKCVVKSLGPNPEGDKEVVLTNTTQMHTTKLTSSVKVTLDKKVTATEVKFKQRKKGSTKTLKGEREPNEMD